MAARHVGVVNGDVGDAAHDTVYQEERRREVEEEEWRRRVSLQQGRSASVELVSEHGIAYSPGAALAPDASGELTSGMESADVDDVESSKDQWGGKGTVMMEEVPPQQQMALNFEHLSAWVPIQVKPPSLPERALKAIKAHGKGAKAADKPVTLQQKAQQHKEGKRQIMYDLSAVVRPGEVLALMGPSGSGKTSLLSVIGGRAAKAVEVSGSVTVNGMPLTKAFRRRIGFVLQDDVLYEDLTVQETLTYAAMLRLPRSMSKKDKLERVGRVIDALGLRKSANTIIGGFLRRGISGGERKRTSIGHELIVNPAVMLLDEPTSGLDSTTALHLLILLQELADGGRAVCTTIHQPSSRLYQKLDRLLLLAEGHAMYYGPAMQVLDWFKPFGYEIPFGVSIPDYVLDLTMGEAGHNVSGNNGTAAITELYTAFEAYLQDHPEGYQAVKHANGTARKRHHAALPMSKPASEGGSSPSSISDARAVLDINGHDATGAGGGVVLKTGAAGGVSKPPERWDGASWLQQVAVLTSRAVRIRRFEQLTGQHFFTLFAVAFITGMVWWQRGTGYSVAAAQDTLGLLFFCLLFPSFRALFHALFTLPNEYRMLLKERPSGLYKLSAYYIGRTLADVPVEMINTFLFIVIAYWFGGLKHTAGAFFAFVASLLLVTLVAEAWGLMIGGACMNAKTAQTITTVIMLAFLLVGGFYVRTIPVWISWIKYLSFLTWGYQLLIKIQFRDAQYYNCVGIPSNQGISQAEAAATPACTPVASTQSALGLPTDPEDSAWPEVLVLLGFLVALRIATYYVLRHKTATRFAASDDAGGKSKGKHKK